MSKLIEKNVAEMIVIGVFLMVFLSSCVSTEVHKYEGLVMDCENCDELD
jgi:hypothetical protein